MVTIMQRAPHGCAWSIGPEEALFHPLAPLCPLHARPTLTQSPSAFTKVGGARPGRWSRGP